MASTQPTPSRSGTGRLRKRQPRPPSPVKNTILILAIAAVFVTGLILTVHGKDFLRSLYSPVAIIVVIFLVIEYIALKGRDRSRIYKIELDHARNKRQQDLEFLRALENELAEIEKGLAEIERTTQSEIPGESGQESGTPQAEAGSSLGRVRDRLAAVRRSLSERL